MFIEKEKVDEKIVYSDMLYREIALRTNSMAYYDRVSLTYGTGSSNMKNLLKHNLIYNADMDVSDRYIKNFMEEFEPDMNYKLHKVYMDIEVDLAPFGLKNKEYIGFPEEELAPCPVNIITLIDEKALVSYGFIVKNSLNPQIKELQNNIEEFKEYIKTIAKERYQVLLNSVEFLFYDTEREAIEAFYSTLHKIDPDFILSWNQGFDAITLQNRLIKLYSSDRELRASGIRPFDAALSVICDKKYMIQKNSRGEDVYLSPKAYYKQNKDQSIVDRSDSYTVLDGINWMDQMLIYANVRKSSGLKESYALDAIANEELGQEKLDYTGYSIKTLPWLNFKKFVEYNTVDVLLLLLLEKKNLDMDMVQRLSEITNTRKDKVFKKTVSLKNFVCKFAENQGFIMGNNKNAQYGNDSEYFEANYLNKKQLVESDEAYRKLYEKKENFGAYVGDPNLNGNDGIVTNSGKQSMFVFENVADNDFSSLYPSIIQAFNLDKNTQVGKFYLNDNKIKNKLIKEFGYDGLFAVSKNEEATADENASVDDIGPTLVDSLQSHNWSRIGEKYFDLPSTEDMIKDLLNQ